MERDDDWSAFLVKIGPEDDYKHLKAPLRSMGTVDDIVEILATDGRVALLKAFKLAGVERLAERQALANAVGKLVRQQLPHAIWPGDPLLFFTPWNWAIFNSVAITATPGAYAKVAWRGGAAEGHIEIGVDSSEAPNTPFMTLSFSLDASPDSAVHEVVPHPGSVERESIIRVSLERLGLTGAPASSSEVHTLTIGVLNSVQRYDRWGSASGSNGGGATHANRLPGAALRLKFIRLPAGAVAAPPPLRPRRMLAFGDSIVEGVGSGYKKGSAGDLKANNALSTWAAHVAGALECECSSVGYGRLGWAVDGNGDVPPFVCTGGDARCSWGHVFDGVARTFEACAPDYLFVSLGTNDGLIHGERADVHTLVSAISTWLARQRSAVGPHAHIVVCVPFGGFGGPRRHPLDVLPRAVGAYQHGCGGDPRCHLLDLGEDAALHLTGFRYNQFGAFEMTSESADGIHPTHARHEQLAQMVLRAVRALLAATTDSPASSAAAGANAGTAADVVADVS